MVDMETVILSVAEREKEQVDVGIGCYICVILRAMISGATVSGGVVPII